MPLPPDHDLGRAAVVTEKQDQRVIEGVHRLQLLDHHPHRLIDRVDHGGMNRHLGRLEGLLLRSQLIPGQRPVDLAGAELLDRIRKGIGRAEIPLHRRKGSCNDPPLHQPLVAGLLHHIPACLVAGSVFFNQLWRRLEGKVRRSEGDVAEKRRARMLPGMLLQAGGGMVADGGGDIEGIVTFDLFAIDRHPGRIEVVVLAPFDPEGMNKALLERLTIHMPLARVIRPVAGRRQQFGQQPCPGRPAGLIPPPHSRHAVTPDRLGVVAGQESPAGRPAAGGVVALREPQPAVGQPVEVRRLDLTAVAAQIGKAHVVGQDHHDIGWGRSCRVV